MSEQYEPIRAWAEHDEWTIFYEWRGKRTKRLAMPKGGEGSGGELPSELGTILEVMKQPGDGRLRFDWGPLRSLRVLLRSGHEVTLESFDVRVDPDDIQRGWELIWQLCVGEEQCINEWRDGGTETDAERVERALAEARAWLEASNGA